MNLFKRNSGFSLIEIMVSMAILGIISVGVATLTLRQNQQLRDLRGQITKDSLVSIVQKYAGDANAIFVTANAAGTVASFKNCVLGTAVCTAGVKTAFGLMDRSGVTIAGGPGAIGEVYYRKDGAMCPAALANTVTCPLRARTSYIAFCYGGAANCTLPDSIQIIYYIEQTVQIQETVQMKTICNDPAPLAPMVCSAPQIVMKMPLASPGTSIPGRLSYWSTATDAASSSVTANDFTLASPCTPTNLGMIQRRTNPGTLKTYLEVCGLWGGVYQFAWLAGDIDSTTFPTPEARMPRIPGMYLCPLNMPSSPCYPYVRNPTPPCAGQIQRMSVCASGVGCTNIGCTPLF